LIAALSRMHKEGHRWLGVLHTHPAAPPVPSSLDQTHWHYPQLSFWILSFSGEQPELRAYQWHSGRFQLRPFELC
jgi:proteasome lid subunit RPN8/RPN11